MHGMNAVEAGVQQIRLRMEKRMFWVSPDCRGLRDEAEEYRMADRPDGEFKVVKERDHRLDALRTRSPPASGTPLRSRSTTSRSAGNRKPPLLFNSYSQP
jgi:hypothetical protein